MKKILFHLASILLLPMCAYAGQYVGLSAGPDFYHQTANTVNKQKVGYKLGGAWGYKFDNGFRVEGEYSYRQGHKNAVTPMINSLAARKEHRHCQSHAMMANIYYDVLPLTFWEVTPYVGVGIGWSRNADKVKTQYDALTYRYRENEHRFAYQGIIGAKYPISETSDLCTYYTYSTLKDHAKNHSFSMQVNRNF